MVLTKKQIVEVLKHLPSDKTSECGAVLFEARQRLKDELEKIKEYEDLGNSLFVQYMKRVGYCETPDYIYQYVGETDGVAIRRKANNALCVSIHDGKTMHPTFYGKDSKLSHKPQFKVCGTCGRPIQEIFLFDEKSEDKVDCRNCFSTKMNTKYGRGGWQFTPQYQMEDNGE